MRQESHRIHWQQWGKDPQSKRDLITRSAAVRLTDAAKALDVVTLLCESLQLSTFGGVLILVGTLYNVPPIQFEHEATNSAPGEPFHLLRTLQSDENPLQVRDKMQRVLDEKQQRYPQQGSSNIAPKLQWFFIPEDAASQIPECVELNGYSTSMEEEDLGDDDDEDEDEFEQQEQEYPDPMDMPWKKEGKEDAGAAMTDEGRKQQRRATQQIQRHQQLASHRSVLDHHVVSGYLWKQSRADPHVWRKVHCVLTEDHFWFVTRVKKNAPFYGRIPLTRALLVEASQSSSMLSRVPFAWEIMSARGGSNVFRAHSRSLQLRWMFCLKDRIEQNEENTFLQQAELIVADETAARTKRLVQLVPKSNNVEVTHWALHVVDYREQCRHIQNRLPSKTLFVASKPTNPLASHEQSSSSSLELPELDPDLTLMVQAAWDLATTLLVQATTHLMKEFKGRNAETLCRHIDYVLTGRMRPLSEAGSPVAEEHVDKSREPPPINVFDNLLAEFEKPAATK